MRSISFCFTGAAFLLVVYLLAALRAKCFVHFSALLAIILMLSAFSSLLLNYWKLARY